MDVWLFNLFCLVSIYVTTATRNRSIFNLDWLCVDERTYARNVPWDCSSYIICSNSIAYSFHCPHSQNYNAILSSCEFDRNYGTNDCLQNPFNYLDLLCFYNPAAKIPSKESCAQYFDCSQKSGTWQYSKYIMECPYPDLFSPQSGKCENFRNVNCEARKEAKAPCQYVQYQQICSDPKKCKSCSSRHPDCLRKPNGFHPVPSSTQYFMFCFKERTLLVKKCAPNKHFLPSISKCA